MLKPIVVGEDTWKTQLQDARSLLTKWFPDELEECELSDNGALTEQCQAQCADADYANEHPVCQAVNQNPVTNE
jgi:MSHA biogenesis protein MshL